MNNEKLNESPMEKYYRENPRELQKYLEQAQLMNPLKSVASIFVDEDTYYKINPRYKPI